LYHTGEMLEAIARGAPELLACTTLCAIDEPGPDTVAAISGWLGSHDQIQIAARIDPTSFAPAQAARVRPIQPAHLSGVSGFARMVASLLVPGGVLVQDIHLSTLQFVPADRWWESIYVAATVRGMFPTRQPAVRFVSNKRGYAATFGRDLMDAGFDPREVVDKTELDQIIVPSIARDVAARFPFVLTLPDGGARPVAADEESRREIDEHLDIVEWDVSGRVELSGSMISNPVTFRSGSSEAVTWQALIADRIGGGQGVAVADVGQRLAEPGAERAEISNLAARHIHTLRSRLTSASAIVTAYHAYRLDDRVRVGRVRRR
jgi:hypothetical protein